MRLHALVIFVIVLTSTCALKRPLYSFINRNKRTHGGIRWLPVYSWGKLRYDPWLLRHPGLWFYSRPVAHIKVAEIKRSSKYPSKWSMFLRRSRLLRDWSDRRDQERIARAQHKKMRGILDRLYKYNVVLPDKYVLPNKEIYHKEYVSKWRENRDGKHTKQYMNNNSKDLQSEQTSHFELSSSKKTAEKVAHGGVESRIDNVKDETRPPVTQVLTEDYDFPDENYFRSQEDHSMIDDYPMEESLDDGQFGDFVDNLIETPNKESKTSCESKEGAVCMRESDCSCDGAAFCVNGRCATQSSQKESAFLDQITFVKRSIPAKAEVKADHSDGVSKVGNLNSKI